MSEQQRFELDGALHRLHQTHFALQGLTNCIAAAIEADEGCLTGMQVDALLTMLAEEVKRNHDELKRVVNQQAVV